MAIRLRLSAFLSALLLALLLLGAACGGDDSSPGPGDGDGDAVVPDGEDDQADTPDGAEPTCIDEDGDGYGEGCELGFDCNDSRRDVYEGAPELCDGVDNDCDDEIDEGCPCEDGRIRSCYTADPETLGVGRCRSGWQSCDGGEWGVCRREVTPQPEVCDRLDNDCDGATDEGLTNACGLCGPVPDEVCGDGLDNDCDGVIDERDAGCDCDGRTQQPCYSGPPHTLGVGVCRGGRFDCVDGEWGRCRGQVLPTAEICDGVDNDCDGLVDESLTNACGECGVPTPREVCDGVDNDCDGLVDEGLVLLCGLCSAEGLVEVCGDGLDNDCDGSVDESCPCEGEPACYPGPPDTRGVGACRDGTRTCDSSGEFWDECEGFRLPQPEVCDGVDNSCDGLIDVTPDGCSVCFSLPEECDGIDNDCDGFVDEYLRNTCGVCLSDVVQEEDCGPACCDGIDNDCDGFVDEGLLNACGTCGESCYVETWSANDENLSEGDLNGIDEDTSEGLRLGSQPFIYPYLWVANSGEATVTKINTQTFEVEASYPVGPSPSRTAVDLNGNVWVANRAFGGQGSVTKIQAEDCEGNECVLFTRSIGDPDDIPRGLAVDEDNRVWVGTYAGRELFEIDNDTGAILNRYDVGLRVYGLAIDSEGIIWISNLERPNYGEGKLGAFNINQRRSVPGSPWLIPTCSNPYGIALDGRGHVWLGNWTCGDIVDFDPQSRTFTHHTPGSGVLNEVRGVAVDASGIVWTVATATNRLGRYDPGTDEWLTVETCSQPMGVGVTGSGHIWTPCWNSDVYYFDSSASYLGSVTAGANPYSYSDMTGFQLRTFTARQGTWTVVYDCGYATCGFDEVAWDASTPVGTSVRMRARTSDDELTWSSRVGPYDLTPADLGGLPDGRYLELELTLMTTETDVSPLVTSIEVSWQRP